MMTHTQLRIVLDIFMIGIQRAEDDGYMTQEYRKQVEKAQKEAFKILREAIGYELFLMEEAEGK